MKFVISFLFVVSMTCLYAQDGFKVIRLAEKKIERGNYERALKLLEKADSMNYGFCGNAWIEARESISLNKAKIYDARGEHVNAANALNAAYLFSNKDTDSLKIVYFIKAFGKEAVKREIDSCINAIATFDPYLSLVEQEFALTFADTPFFLSYPTLTSIRHEIYRSIETDKNTPFVDMYKNALRRQAFYLLLL